MANGYVTPESGDVSALVRELGDLRARVKELERPTGTQLFDSVAELKTLVQDLQTRIDDLLAAGVTTTNLHATGTSDLDGTLRSLGAAATDVSLLPGSRSALWIHDATGTIGFAP